MPRTVALRLLLTTSAFLVGATGVALMGAEQAEAVRLAAAGLILFALALVPLAYQPQPEHRATLAGSLVLFGLGLLAHLQMVGALFGATTASGLGVLAMVLAAGQLACLRSAPLAARASA